MREAEVDRGLVWISVEEYVLCGAFGLTESYSDPGVTSVECGIGAASAIPAFA
jgi:hypothetical protein